MSAASPSARPSPSHRTRLRRGIAPTGDHRRQHEPGRRHHPVQHRGLGRSDDHAGERSAADHGGRHDRRLHAAGSIGEHASGGPGPRHRDPRRDSPAPDDGHADWTSGCRRDGPRTRDQPVPAVPDRRQLVVPPLEPRRRRLLPRLEPGWTARLRRPGGAPEASDPNLALGGSSGCAQSDLAVDERHRDHHLRRRVGFVRGNLIGTDISGRGGCRAASLEDPVSLLNPGDAGLGGSARRRRKRHRRVRPLDQPGLGTTTIQGNSSVSMPAEQHHLQRRSRITSPPAA